MFRAQWRLGTETYVKHTRADRMQAIAEKDKYSNGDTSYRAAALCISNMFLFWSPYCLTPLGHAIVLYHI